MKPAPCDYARAGDVADAVRLLAQGEGNAKVIAGGQSLGPLMNLRLARPSLLVDIHRGADLVCVDEATDSVRYGAMVRHADLEDGRVPDAAAGMLRSVAAGIAYRPVRNRGTLGGSLAHADPAADWVSAMTALDADFELVGPGGPRNLPALGYMQAAFMTAIGTDEVLAAVRVPRLGPAARWGYYKFCRKVGEFSEATGVAVADPERGYARIVVGALGGPPQCLDGVADELASNGVAAAQSAVASAVDAALPGYSPVQRQLYATAVKRALAQLDDGAS